MSTVQKELLASRLAGEAQENSAVAMNSVGGPLNNRKGNGRIRSMEAVGYIQRAAATGEGVRSTEAGGRAAGGGRRDIKSIAQGLRNQQRAKEI